jgi:hypothetical protein
MVRAFDGGFRFTIVAGNKRVAVITADDRLMLDGFVDGEFEEGKEFRQSMASLDAAYGTASR